MNEAWIALVATLLGGGSVYGIDCLLYYVSARGPEKAPAYDYTQLAPDQFAFLVRNGWNPPQSVQEFFGWLDCDGEFCDTKCYNSHPATADELDAKWTATKPPASEALVPEGQPIPGWARSYFQPEPKGQREPPRAVQPPPRLSRYEMLHDLKKIGIEPPYDYSTERLRIIHDREMKKADVPWTSWIDTERIRG